MGKSFNSGEWTPPQGRRECRRVSDARAIIHSIVDFHQAEVLPTQSSHYRIPGEIGSVTFSETLQLHLEMDRWEDESYRTE